MKQIRKVSLKEQKRLRKYSAQKKTEFADHDENICAVALLENKTPEVVELFKYCQYWATQNHHEAGRIGDHMFDKGKKLCGVCHEVVETHPAIAKKLGLSKSRLSIHIK